MTVLRLHLIPASVHMWQESIVKVSSLHILAHLDEFPLLRPSTLTDMCVGVCAIYSKHYFAFWNNVNSYILQSAFCKGVEKWLFRVVNYAPVVQYNANLSIHCNADGQSFYFSQLQWSRVWFGLVFPLALAIVNYILCTVPISTRVADQRSDTMCIRTGLQSVR